VARLTLETGIVRDRRYYRHGTDYHPESPKRLEAIYNMLDGPDMVGKFVDIPPRYASHEELATVHSPSYINMVAGTAGLPYYSLDPDTETTADSYDTAKLAVGGVCNAIDYTVAGEVRNAFALIRPPGHHAHPDEAAGFCIFNNIALGAMHAIREHKMDRILIIDWDLHHGDGTQAIFYDDPRVLYFSTHQYPYYPGSGAVSETGRGKGAGYTINVPLSAGADDALFLKIYKKILEPVALAFKPDLVMLSAGFDIYFQDPLGGMKVTPQGFANLTRVIMDIAEQCCSERFVVVLEGGYHVTGLAKSVKKVLLEMRGETLVTDAQLQQVMQEADHSRDALISRVIQQLEPMWKVF
jgi:acetoin utilization deacetylase AcuC-like enzyme